MTIETPGTAPRREPDVRTLMRYDANKKSTAVAYLLWFFLGFFGAHRFYLDAAGTGAAILILSVLSFMLSFVAIGLLLFAVPTIWLFVDLFLIPGLAREYNNRLASQLAG